MYQASLPPAPSGPARPRPAGPDRLAGPVDQGDLPPPPAFPAPGPVRRWAHRAGASPWGPVAVGALGLAACAYTLVADPNTSGAYPQCTFHQLTGLDCPGCGLTRGIHALITGHPLQALSHNLLLLVLVPLTVFSFVRYAGRRWFGWQFRRLQVPPAAAWALGAFVLAFAVTRNIDWGPLAWLDAAA